MQKTEACGHACMFCHSEGAQWGNAPEIKAAVPKAPISTADRLVNWARQQEGGYRIKPTLSIF